MQLRHAMTQDLTKPPRVEHGPLHSVEALALALPQVQRLLLPEALNPPRGPWAYAAMLGPVALFLGWKAMQVPGLDAPPISWGVAVVTGVLAAAAIWVLARQERRWRGWCVDFEQLRIMAVGQGHQLPIVLNATEHSLGCYVGSSAAHGTCFVLELRHVRRGPVAQLTSVTFSAVRQAAWNQQLQQLDRCVDMLAERLHIRRSGEPLRPMR